MEAVLARARLRQVLSQREDMDDVIPETYSFSATTVAVTEEDDVLTVGFASSHANEYFLLQRYLNFDDADDQGVYVELNDQINSGYSLVKKCVVAPTQLIVLLAQPLLKSKRIVVDLDSLGDDNHFVSNLSRVFTGHWDLFTIRP